MGQTLPQRVRQVVQQRETEPVQFFKANATAGANVANPFQKVSYRDFWNKVQEFAVGLAVLGVKRGGHAVLISDNRPEWLVVDLAILSLGGVDVPRGSDITKDELAFIVTHADCETALVEDQTQLEKLVNLSSLGALRTVIVLDNSLGQHRRAPSSLQLLNFEEVLTLGRHDKLKRPSFFDAEVSAGSEEDLATIIYTSGTTGEPKGVMLSHRAFLFQMERALEVLKLLPQDIFLSVLPIWHAFERAIEYIILGGGASICYSKPVGKVMLDDMAAIKPTWFISVPRIWESIRAAILRKVKEQGRLVRRVFDFFITAGTHYADYRDKLLDRWPHFTSYWPWAQKARAALPFALLWPIHALGDALIFRKLRQLLGGRFLAGISGGGALPGQVDAFFRAVGVLVLEGYGLTETAPVLSVRLLKHPVPHTVGPLLRDIRFEIREEGTGKVLPAGHKGELWVRTPQVMLGYYKRPELTAKILADGWLNTGDLAVATVRNELRLVGRSKDTIVLLGGENVEPAPLEQRLLEADFIDQVMVVGQDQKFLGALIVPQFDLMEEWARAKQISYMDREELLENPQILEYVREIIQALINPRSGFKPYEGIYQFKLLPRPFEPMVEVTASLKLKRNVITQRRAQQIAALFNGHKV